MYQPLYINTAAFCAAACLALALAIYATTARSRPGSLWRSETLLGILLSLFVSLVPGSLAALVAFAANAGRELEILGEGRVTGLLAWSLVALAVTTLLIRRTLAANRSAPVASILPFEPPRKPPAPRGRGRQRVAA